MQEKLDLDNATKYKLLSYFDTKNLATLVTCPVISAIGLQDPVCPPHTNFAPYNNFKSEEKIQSASTRHLPIGITLTWTSSSSI